MNNLYKDDDNDNNEEDDGWGFFIELDPPTSQKYKIKNLKKVPNKLQISNIIIYCFAFTFISSFFYLLQIRMKVTNI